MSKSTPLDRTIYTEGQNGIVRLPPEIWRAFHESALLLEVDSTQECFLRYLLAGGRIMWQTRVDNVLEVLERSPFVMSFQKWELEFAQRPQPPVRKTGSQDL